MPTTRFSIRKLFHPFYNRVLIGDTVCFWNSTMFESNQIEHWQRRKQVCLGLIKVPGVLLVLCLGARLIPVINDWLSGPAEPMRAITQQLAKASATATEQQYPIIVTRAENLSSQTA